MLIHESCLVRQEDMRELRFVRDKVIAGQVVDKKGFEMSMSDASTNFPICSSFKHNNYTRSYCRQQQKHCHLPWNTEYDILYKTDKPLLGESFVAYASQNNDQSTCVDPFQKLRLKKKNSKKLTKEKKT